MEITYQMKLLEIVMLDGKICIKYNIRKKILVL